MSGVTSICRALVAVEYRRGRRTGREKALIGRSVVGRRLRVPTNFETNLVQKPLQFGMIGNRLSFRIAALDALSDLFDGEAFFCLSHPQATGRPRFLPQSLLPVLPPYPVGTPPGETRRRLAGSSPPRY